MNIGRGLKAGQVDLDTELVVQGLKDSLAEGKARLTEAEMSETLAKFGQELRVVQQHRRTQLAEENLRQGELFLAQNKTNPGVVSLPSGLQYKVIKPGTGQSPDLTNWVSLKFRGTRINGAEFDKSDTHPRANIFCLGSVIQGWAEALQQMQPGARWQLFVPASLAYGRDGSPAVGPNETLIYDLELASILPGPPPPTPEDIKNERDPNGD
jgi:FKBP-type peptidyl-prolyl cis-trans isomerase FklB